MRYPDYYGIDMAKMSEFIAFKAAVELLKEREMRDVIAAAYRKSKEQVGLPKEQMVNYVKEIYAPFPDEEISAKMVELLTPKGTKAKVQIVYQPLEGLHEACPKHPGDWYFSGDYPTPGGVKLLNNVSFTLSRTDKVAFIGESEQAITMLFKILMEEEQPDEGTFKWGVSTSTSYFPVDNSVYFNDCDLSILDWIRQYSKTDETETYLRGFLGRMLFSGDDIYKPVKVLSGGEKVRCMFSRMMLYHSNVLLLDRPTNHLDLESITAVNNGLTAFKGVVILSSHDHEILQTVANRIIEITPDGCLDRQGTYEEFLDWKKENQK